MVVETIIIAGVAVAAVAYVLRRRQKNAPHGVDRPVSDAADRPSPGTAGLLERKPALEAALPTRELPGLPSLAPPPVTDNDPSTRLGQTVGGYTLLEFLGQGGMASVYKVRAKSGGGFLALKLILDQFAKDQAFRRRFEREVEVCKVLKHPNIVALEDWGDEDGTMFLALEYVDGDVLTARLRDEGLPLAEALPYVVSLIDGLAYAHGLGVVHRDLKPDNVIVSSTGQVKIADFGLARTQDGEKITKTGDSMGTPAYFPPEQIAGALPTGAADQYSLGIILYELLTGKRPFNEKNPLKMLFQHLSEPPPSPLSHRPDLHPTLVAIVLRMLEKSPESRFASLLTVKEGLQAVARGEEWQLPAAPVAQPRSERALPNIQPAGVDDAPDDGTMEFQIQTEVES